MMDNTKQKTSVALENMTRRLQEILVKIRDDRDENGQQKRHAYSQLLIKTAREQGADPMELLMLGLEFASTESSVLLHWITTLGPELKEILDGYLEDRKVEEQQKAAA